MNPLLALVKEAQNKPGVTFHENSDGDISRIRQQVPAVVAELSLQDVLTPSGVGNTGYGNIISRSLVAQAGAHIITIPGLNYVGNPTPGKELMSLVQRKERFVTIEAAPFESVPDSESLSISNKPYLIANFDSTTAPIYGVGFTLSRRDIKDLADQVALNAVMSSIEMGLANIVDHVLLARLKTSAPTLEQPSSSALLKAAAARGLHFAELSAIAGGELSGVEVAQDGALRAYGIQAELTKFSDATIIGAFNRAAVSIEDDFRITAYRKLNAAVEVVCWVQAQAQVPDNSAFWRI